jgi:hypothetical protein
MGGSSVKVEKVYLSVPKLKVVDGMSTASGGADARMVVVDRGQGAVLGGGKRKGKGKWRRDIERLSEGLFRETPEFLTVSRHSTCINSICTNVANLSSIISLMYLYRTWTSHLNHFYPISDPYTHLNDWSLCGMTHTFPKNLYRLSTSPK